MTSKPSNTKVYLRCVISVDHDLPLIDPFIKYYKKLGVDEFLLVLNSKLPKSNNLSKAKNILKKHNIKEKKVWIGQYTDAVRTQYLYELTDKLKPDEWILTADCDEFQKYDMDLKKFIDYCDNNDITRVHGVMVDRLSKDGSFVDLKKDIDLFEQFPVNANVCKIWKGSGFFIQKVMLHKNFIKLYKGNHKIKWKISLNSGKSKSGLIVYHIKWFSGVVEKTKNSTRNKMKNMPNKLLLKKYFETHKGFNLDDVRLYNKKNGELDLSYVPIYTPVKRFLIRRLSQAQS